MAPSSSKQKRLAEKAAKRAAGGNSEAASSSAPGSNGTSTPLTSMSGAASKAGSQEDLMSMARLNIATDR